MIANYVLIVWVALNPGEPASVYHLTGGITAAQCAAKAATVKAEAQNRFPGKQVVEACYPMVPA